MKTFVKFCGLTDATAVRLVADGGAAGFVIGVPMSPRNLTSEAAAQLVGLVPQEAEAWAVTVNPTTDFVHRLFDEVGVDRIQVYGPVPEGLEFLENHHLVPSIPIPPAGEEGPEPKVPPAEDFSRVHLDAAGQPLPGGSGMRTNWEVCSRIIEANPGRKFILAGGLTPDNVGEALAAVRPWGVDVSTGVERERGVKDPAKLRAFLHAVEEFEKSNA